MSLQSIDFTPCFLFLCFCTDLFGKVNCWVKLSALTINGAGQTKGCNFIIPQMRLERFALSLLPLPSGQRQEESLPFGWCLLVPCPRRSGRSPRRRTTEALHALLQLFSNPVQKCRERRKVLCFVGILL